MRSTRASCLVAALVTACGGGHHVKLERPAWNRDFQVRLDNLETLGPAIGLEVFSMRCHLVGCEVTKEATALVLGNGSVVTDPTDLLPVVEDDSATARYARAAERARRRQKQSGLGGLAVSLGGVGLWFVSRHDDVNGKQGSEAGRYAGYGLAVGGLVTALFVGWVYHARAERATKAAFESYVFDLADTLHICVKQYKLVPCETGKAPVATPPPAPTQEPTPASAPTPPPAPAPTPPAPSPATAP